MVRTRCIHSCGPGFQSLVEELKSHKLRNAARKRKEEQEENSLNRACGETRCRHVTAAAYGQVTAVLIVPALPRLVGPASCRFQRSLATKECEAKGQGR